MLEFGAARCGLYTARTPGARVPHRGAIGA